MIGVKSHLNLFSLNKQNLQTYFSSPYRITLILFFSVLYLPHAFVVVRDFNFVIAYEIDPGSIIEAIFSQLRHFYNMNESYHSTQYGWTYFDINYFLLLPIYILTKLNVIKDDFYIFVSIRLIFFAIGLSSLLAYFEVVKRTLGNNFVSFIASLLYIASPALSLFFYVIHPETTGLLLLFIAILCLLRYHETEANDHRWYTIGLISLVLSSLSKQVFLFTALPVLFLFVWFYSYHHNISIPNFVISKHFFKALLVSTTISIVVFFIVNPFAFIQWREFLANQNLLYSIVVSSPLTHAEAIRKWIGIIQRTHVVYVSIILAPLTLLGAFILDRNQKVGRMLYIVNIIGAILFIIIISVTSRYIIYNGYYAPIYPFFILNLMAISLYIVRNLNSKFLKLLFVIPLIYFWFLVGLSEFSASIPLGFARLMYKESLVYKSYEYIKNEVPDGSRVVYDQFVAIPAGKGIVSCKNWRGCGTDYIEQFQPEYILFSEDWKLNGATPPETARLIKYIDDHNFVLITEIESDNLYTQGNYVVTVWKKPGN